jgi:HEAT repeat protein
MDYIDINHCIQVLNEKPKWFFQKDNIAEKLQCLDTIKKAGTPSTIYSLFGFLKSDNKLIQEKSAETILQLFSKLKSQNDYTDSLKHLNIDKSDLDLFRIGFGERTYLQLLGIASLNSSGYVREKAVKELARLKNTAGLKFILLRLSDWVLPVRQAASEAINSYLDIAYIDELLKQLSIIDWLLNVKRVDLTKTHSRIIEFIFKQEFSDDFYHKIKRLDDKTRLRYYKKFFKHAKVNKEQAIRIFSDKNFLIRLEVLKQLSFFDTEFQKEFITASLQDPSVRIRVNALYATRPYSPDIDNKIENLLSDESSTVRELCRLLLKSKELDFAEIYRERIKQGQFLSGSLTGLSEVGTNDDLQIFEQHINSNKSKIIIGCLTAINKFNPDKAKHHSLELLTHSIKRVRNKAAEILAKRCDSDTLQKVRQIYLAGDYEIKKTILKLYNKIGGWSVIGDFLIALTDEDSTIQNIGWQLLDKWKANVVRLFTTPPKVEIERANSIYKSLDTSKIKLTHSRTNLLQDLQFYLR